MKKLFTILMLLCSVVAWGQEEYIKEYMRKAEAGDAEAQGQLAWHYYCGMGGLSKDYDEAVRWARKAADQGDAQGMDILGSCYMFGHGIAKDKDEAVRWHKKAAAKGYVTSFFALGLYYKDIDKDEAIYWFKKEMDAYYSNYGKEDEIAAEELLALGVEYHPGQITGTSNSLSNSSTGQQDESLYYDYVATHYEEGADDDYYTFKKIKVCFGVKKVSIVFYKADNSVFRDKRGNIVEVTFDFMQIEDDGQVVYSLFSEKASKDVGYQDYIIISPERDMIIYCTEYYNGNGRNQAREFKISRQPKVPSWFK